MPARLLGDVAAGAEEDRSHAETVRGSDVVVDAVADHDRFGGGDAKVFAGTQEEPDIGFAQAVVAGDFAVSEELAEACLVERGEHAGGLVGGKAEEDATAVEVAEDRLDSGPGLDAATFPGPGGTPFGCLERYVHKLGQRCLASAEPPDDGGVGIGSEGGDGVISGSLEAGFVEADAVFAKCRFDVTVDEALGDDLRIEGATDIEEDSSHGETFVAWSAGRTRRASAGPILARHG